MKVLYSQSTQAIRQYPRQDDEPVVGLDPDYLVLEKVNTTPPSYDPDTQYLAESWVVDLEALEYREVWSEESLPPPSPDWEGFLTPFYQPAYAGSPFDIIENLVQQATLNAEGGTVEGKKAAMSLRTHWTNCVSGLINPYIRSREWLSVTYFALKSNLELCQVPLSESEDAAIMALFEQFHLV